MLTILRHQIVNQKIRLLFIFTIVCLYQDVTSFLNIKWILVNWKTVKLASMECDFIANKRTLFYCIMTWSHSAVNNVVEWIAALFCLLNAMRSKFCMRKKLKENA